MADEIIFSSYNLNPLMRNVLITNSEVIFHAPTKQTFDPRTVQQSIIIAEERFIRPALGNALYNAMAASKNVLITVDNISQYQSLVSNGVVLRPGHILNSHLLLSAENKALWLDILWKLVSECVGLTAYPDAWVQFGADGPIHAAPHKGLFEQGGMLSPDLASVKFIMDKKQMDRIDPLLFALQSYLCANKSAYPLFCGCPDAVQDSNGNTVQELQPKRSDWVTGLYDDVDSRKGCVYDKGFNY